MSKMVFVDVETGGLDCKVHALLSVGAVVFDPETGEIGEQYYSLMKPAPHLAITEEALKINGLTWDEIMAARPEGEVYFEFCSWMDSKSVKDVPRFAHYAEFDSGFLREWESRMRLVNGHRFKSHSSMRCSKQLVMLAQLIGHYPADNSTSLSNVCEYFGIKPGGHNALNDAVAGARVVCELYKRFGWVKATP